MTTDYAIQRSISDIQSRIASLDHSVMAAAHARHRSGSLIARLATCELLATIENQKPVDICRQHFGSDRDLSRLIATRAASGPALTTQTTWAAELAAVVVADIADNMLPSSAFSQLRAQGLQYMFVDGAVARTPTHTPAPSGAFILEGSPIPLGALLLGSLTLKPKKAGGLTAVTRELLAGTPINVEQSLRVLLEQDIGLLVDSILLGNAAVTTAQPAGLLNGVTPLTATAGGGVNALLGDVKKLFAAITPAIKPVLIANSVQAASIGILAQASPPVIVAPYLAADTVIAVDAAAFASALGAIDFSVSEEAALHMADAPLQIGTPGSPPTVAAPTSSMWQQALTALRVLLDCDWTLRRTGAVATITGVTW